MDMKNITLVGAVKAGAAGFEGWASTSQIDRQGDIVLPTAFQSSLPAFLANGPIFWNHAEVHDPLAKPIGRATDATIRDGGLHIKARWASHEEAQTVRSLVTDGIVSSLSIGFNPVRSTMRGGVNVIEELELMEVSVVAIPANPGAVILASKTLAGLIAPDEAKGMPSDDVGTGSAILAALANLKDAETGSEGVDLLDHAINDLIAWMSTEAAEIGTVDYSQPMMDDSAMLMSARPRNLTYRRR